MTLHPQTLDPETSAAYRTIKMTKDGRASASAPLDAGSDDEALSLAAVMARDAGLDLWHGLRFIAHFGPEPGKD